MSVPMLLYILMYFERRKVGRVEPTIGGPGDIAGGAMKQVKSLAWIGKTNQGGEAVSEQAGKSSLHHQLHSILE
jgi:hypothetical protein